MTVSNCANDHVTSFKFRVSNGTPVRVFDDGRVLCGTRRFTPTELVQYVKNMYGNSYYRRLGIKNSKRLTHEQRCERSRRIVQICKEKYGDDFYHQNAIRANATRMKRPDWEDMCRKQVQTMRTPEALERGRKTRQAMRYEISTHHPLHAWYFICDCEIDGQEFSEGEWIDSRSPLCDKAKMMYLVDVYLALTPETKEVARIYRNKFYYNRTRAKRWFRRRPDVVFAMVKNL